MFLKQTNNNERVNKMIKAIELKKGEQIKTNQLGLETSAILLESPKQGKGLKQTILVDCKGSEVGMFDEIGSVYINQIKKVFRDNNWYQVEI
jgi:hypothetical protein